MQTVVLKRKTKCRACLQAMAAGETAVRLRLKKSIAAVGCPTCSRKLVKLKNFHTTCAPVDINKAMGYDASAHQHVPTPGAPDTSSVPPPPKPKSQQDLNLEALASLEAALVCKVKPLLKLNPTTRKMELPPDVEKQFKTLQGIKARVLRPGTEAEGEVALPIALKRIIDMVYNGK